MEVFISIKIIVSSFALTSVSGTHCRSFPVRLHHDRDSPLTTRSKLLCIFIHSFLIPRSSIASHLLCSNGNNSKTRRIPTPGTQNSIMRRGRKFCKDALFQACGARGSRPLLRLGCRSIRYSSRCEEGFPHTSATISPR
jgi:hypothetical protein